MPIYEYRCEACGHALEALQKLSDEPLRECPECGAPQLRRLVSAPAIGVQEDQADTDKEAKDKDKDKDKGKEKEKKRNLADDGKRASDKKEGEKREKREKSDKKETNKSESSSKKASTSDGSSGTAAA